MSPETCSYHGQFDNEIKQLLQEQSGMRADQMHVIGTLGRIERSITELKDTFTDRIIAVETEQNTQREKLASQAEKMAVVSTKTNLFWTFLIDKNGIVILGIVAYLVIGKAW